jgi:AraC-like DNA-binding protein
VREFRTADPAEAHAALRERYVQHRTTVEGSVEGFRFTLLGTTAGPLRIDLVRYTMRTAATSFPFGFLVFVQVARGLQLLRSGREDVRVGPGDSAAADPSQGATVVAIALRWGFAKPGRFADYYRQQYGRLPSETLRG